MEHQFSNEDRERKNRFAYSGADTPRSASQPPTTNSDGFYSTPAMQIYGSPGGRNGTGTLGTGHGSPWAMSGGQGRGPPLARSASSSIGIPSSLPHSSSFSASAEHAAYGGGGGFASAIRESHSFPSTFEDDESEVLSDATGEYAFPESAQLRGRHFLPTDTRSRSQSLATTTATRPLPIGSPPATAGWASGPLSIPGRFGDIKAPGSGLGSRYGSLGTLARSPVGASPSPTGLRVSTGHAELTNISPLARDVGQIMLDEDAWAGNGGDSGTTSRRHSVSIVQPRRGIVGFNAPDSQDDVNHQYYMDSNSNGTENGGARGGGLTISDDELAVGLNMLNLNPPQSRSSLPPSQPSSLPIYAPLSRTSHDPPGSLAESLSVPAGEHFPSRRMLRSPSESAYSMSSGGSPPRNPEHSPVLESAYLTRQQQQRYVPGHGIQYIPEDAPAPASPTFMRSIAGPNQSFMQMQAHGQMPLSPTRGGHSQQMQMQQLLHQQQLAGAPALQRRASQGEGFMGLGGGGGQHASMQQPTFADLGRGVPLHAVPGTWALYIVEFKAGRTDLFYVAEAGIPPLRVGDLVIVEADRGKDLGKVVNDTITAAEVEAFQRQQAAQQAAYGEHGGGYGGGPTSPDSAGPAPPHGKKEINPKKIYGKATAQDAQLLVTKHQDEAKALALCQSKVKQKKLPMEVIDAEYQWDRRKLTFYFIAEKRIDFRELVRELFRLYKTRIWMASLQGPTSPE